MHNRDLDMLLDWVCKLNDEIDRKDKILLEISKILSYTDCSPMRKIQRIQKIFEKYKI